MVARLRAKPGGADLPVVIGDMTTTRVDGSFRLVYLVFNTIMNLTTQAAQVAAFRNAAAHLEPGGVFLVEVGVPDLQRLPPGETFRTYRLDATHWSIDEIDVVTQALTSHHMAAVDGRLERVAIPFRYAWPAELDLMAELAGSACATAGAAGATSRSRPTAAGTCRSGSGPPSGSSRSRRGSGGSSAPVADLNTQVSTLPTQIERHRDAVGARVADRDVDRRGRRRARQEAGVKDDVAAGRSGRRPSGCPSSPWRRTGRPSGRSVSSVRGRAGHEPAGQGRSARSRRVSINRPGLQRIEGQAVAGPAGSSRSRRG